MNTMAQVVVVDDSPTQAQKIAAYISRFDINVSIATDARQGLRLIDAHEPNAIIMDLYMPILNGFQLCRRIKRDKKTAHIPVIMVTSSDSQQDVMMGVNAGVDKYLVKDSDLAENLMKILREFGI